MTSQSIIQGIVLLLYLIAMVMVGFVFYKKNSTHSDYVLGGRGMNVWVTSLSAQASDMSGWLLMGLPGTAYLLGSGATNAIWTAIGLAPKPSDTPSVILPISDHSNVFEVRPLYIKQGTTIIAANISNP